MLNKVDGIKKLSKKELEESRKIVLASINEEFKKGQELLEGNNKTPNKKVDGIFSSLKQLKNNNKQQVQKKEITDTEKKEWKKEIGKIVEIEKPRLKIKEEKIREMQLQKQRQIEQERLREINALKEKEEEKKKKKEEEEKRKRAPQGGERKTTKNSEKKENKRTIKERKRSF